MSHEILCPPPSFTCLYVTATMKDGVEESWMKGVQSGDFKEPLDKEKSEFLIHFFQESHPEEPSNQGLCIGLCVKELNFKYVKPLRIGVIIAVKQKLP